MKIVGICACTSGIAHTYISREKLVNAGQKRGHTISIETQGTIGTEFELTPLEIEQADIVILAVDIKVSEDRFKGKKVVKVPTHIAIKAANQLIAKLEAEV
ncbi:MAG: PTS fructose transporter subunit IIB [Coprobacillaceae bacterium]